MTEEDLLRLIEEKCPEDLTLEELKVLARRAAGSARLRQALQGRLELETVLHGTLAPVQVSVDTILARMPASRRGSRWGLWLLLLAVLGSLLAVLVVPPGSLEPRGPLVRAGAPAGAADEEAPGPALSSKAEAEEEGAAEPFPQSFVPGGPEGRSRVPGAPSEALAMPPAALASPRPAPGPRSPKKRDPRSSQTASEGPETGLTGKELARLLAPVEGIPGRIAEEKRGDLRVASFQGLYRLSSPWPEEGVLWLSFAEPEDLQLHFWTGKAGVTLRYYPRASLWAAYRVSRKDGAPRPEALALVATDDGRSQRSLGGGLEIRQAAGALVMTRGEVRLLTAPLSGPPESVFIEGKAQVKSLGLSRGAPLELEPPDPRPSILGGAAPASLEWKGELPQGANFLKLADGGVELSSTKVAAFTGARLPRRGLFEFRLEVEDPSAGTGVFLGGPDGRPLHRLGFLTERRSGRTLFGIMKPGEERTEWPPELNPEPLPFAGARQWLRLVLGCRTLKCFTSGDGVHWSRALEPLSELPGGAITSIGLYSLAGGGRRAIRLRSLEARELEAIASLAPRELVERAPALEERADPGSWLLQVLSSQPSGIDPSAWRFGCAIRTLEAAPPPGLGHALLESIVSERVDRLAREPKLDLNGLPAILRLLEEAALLADTWEAPSGRRFTRRLFEEYERVGRLLARRDQPRPLETVLPALAAAPLWTRAPLDLLPRSLLKEELLSAVAGEDWKAVLDLCRRLRSWSEPAPRKAGEGGELRALLDWAGTLAARGLPQEDGRRAASIPAAWRHPLIEELDKDGYNTLAEFQAAVESKAYQSACQIISSAGAHRAVGFLPDGRDPRLLVSLPGAVAGALRESPELRRTMGEEFGPLGLLRVRQAAADGDVPAVEAAAAQFSGTEAACEARSWLGDRLLSAGDFTRALGQYREALAGAPSSKRAGLAARIRLAGASSGQELGGPASEPVELGGLRIAPADFERLVSQALGERGGSPARSGSGGAAEGPSLLRQGLYEARSWPEIQPAGATAPPKTERAERGESQSKGSKSKKNRSKSEPPARQVEKPARQPGRNAGESRPARSGLDGSARESVLELEGSLLVAGSPGRLTAFDVEKKAELWSRAAGDPPLPGQSGPTAAPRPLISGDRIYLRVLRRSGAQVECYSARKGQLLWRSAVVDRVASDPLLIQGELFALTAAGRPGQTLRLSFTSLDRASGKVIAERPLASWQDVWDGLIPCQASAVLDRVVARAGGTILSFDLLGEPRWLHKEVWIPHEVGLRPPEASPDPPLIVAGRVFVAPVGARGLECLDLESGRLQWQRSIPESRRLLGETDGRLILETSEGLLALSQTGEVLWAHRIDHPLEASLPHGGEAILVAYRERDRTDSENWWPCLAWLDPATGAETARSPLFGLAGADPRLGPLVARGERAWALAGGGEAGAREVLELERRGDPLPGRSDPAPLERWTAHLDRELKGFVEAALPGWSLLWPGKEEGMGLLLAARGEAEVLATVVSRESPLVLAREVQVAPGGKARLAIKVAEEGRSGFRVRLEAGGKKLLEERVEPSGSGGWREWQADLSSLAGERVWLLLRAEPLDSPARIYWRLLGPLSLETAGR